MTKLILHYAPDNASLCIRLALNAVGAKFEARLVNRATSAHKSSAYRSLNPNGLIPVLETPDGALFETAAILLWLAQQHPQLLPVQSDERAQSVKWLIWLSNTLHPTLRMLFYPDQYIDASGRTALSSATYQRLRDQLAILDTGLRDVPWVGGQAPTLVDCYLCPMVRWMQLYPKDAVTRPQLAGFPTLQRIASINEGYASTAVAALAEGLGAHPFTAPRYATPPEGSAT